MNIIIDIGNSKTKVAFFENSNLISKKIFNELNMKVFDYINSNISDNDKIIISAVKKNNFTKIFEFKNVVKYFIVLDKNTKLPIINDYLDKNSLGYDRIAAAVGASVLSEKKDNLIIDIGTAITIDFVENNKFKGGNISPGIDIRYRALNNYTDKLPLLNNREYLNLYGNTTNESIISGVINGIIYEIRGAIDSFSEKFKNINIFITGGDAFFFDKKIKRSIFVNSNLVLIGLNRILEINV